MRSHSAISTMRCLVSYLNAWSGDDREGVRTYDLNETREHGDAWPLGTRDASEPRGHSV
jgi:hypothetical protein